jgi:hypothetical protein
MIDQRFIEDLAQDLVLPKEPQPEMQLASANTGVTTDGGAFVGYRMNMPKGLNTRENQAKQSVLIADTMAGGGKGGVQGFLGLPGDLESIGRMALGYLGYNVDENTKLPTSEEIGKRLESVLGPVVPQGQTTGVPTEERVRAAEGGELGGELLAPGGQVKLAGKVIKATKDLPVGMSIDAVDGMDAIFQKAPKIESKAFKNWFGESKAVDESNKPIVLYHGTGVDVTEFKTTGGKGKTSGTGLFLTNDPDLASTYVPTHPAMNSVIYPVYASMKKPFVVDFNGSNWNRGGADALVELPDGTQDDLLSYFNASRDETVSTDDVARLAREMGYDGVIIKNVFDNGPYGVKKNDNPSDLYVVFEPTQVKSAIGNKGTFDPKDPSILKGVGVGGTGAAMSQEENK